MVATRQRDYDNIDSNPALCPSPQLPAGMADNNPGEVQQQQEEAQEDQVRNCALPKDASKLPIFRGNEEDVPHLESFLKALRRYFKANRSSYACDPGDELKLATIGNCFPLHSLARLWFDNAEDELSSYDDFEDSLRDHFQAGEDNLVKLQQTWEQSRQGRSATREFYTHLLQLRMRIAAIDPEENPSEREFLRKFCANLREPIRTVIAKKRITEPYLTLTQLVKLAELEERTGPSPSTALRNLGFGQRDKAAPRNNPPKDTPKSTDADSAAGSKQKWCFYCRSSTHSDKECRRIAARRAAGTWTDRTSPKK
jgi:hypothetical protein